MPANGDGRDAGGNRPRADREALVLAHSSDFHIGSHSRGETLGALSSIISTAIEGSADVLILAGDIFDHDRLPLEVLDSAARLLDDSPFPVVILPGNHDCLVPSSVYRRGGRRIPITSACSGSPT